MTSKSRDKINSRPNVPKYGKRNKHNITVKSMDDFGEMNVNGFIKDYLIYITNIIINNDLKYRTFTEPVSKKVSGYHKLIKKPMDLSTVIKKIKNNKYKTLNNYESDIELIWNNCYTFNGKRNSYSNHAKKLDGIFNQEWKLFADELKKQGWIKKSKSNSVKSDTTEDTKVTKKRRKVANNDIKENDEGISNTNGDGNIMESRNIIKNDIGINDFQKQFSNELNGLKTKLHNLEAKYESFMKKYHEIMVFLQSINLTEYFDLLVNEGFETINDLKYITKDVLKDIGINKSGHYLKILTGIKEYNINDKKRKNTNNDEPPSKKRRTQ